MIQFKESYKFQKEYKKLLKKYRSLDADINDLKDILESEPIGTNKIITRKGGDNPVVILKTRLLCDYLKKSSIRLVYTYFEEQKHIEFLEIYFKGDKTNHDAKRIKQYMISLDK